MKCSSGIKRAPKGEDLSLPVLPGEVALFPPSGVWGLPTLTANREGIRSRRQEARLEGLETGYSPMQTLLG